MESALPQEGHRKATISEFIGESGVLVDMATFLEGGVVSIVCDGRSPRRGQPQLPFSASLAARIIFLSNCF